jgi:hypothetical protein
MIHCGTTTQPFNNMQVSIYLEDRHTYWVRLPSGMSHRFDSLKEAQASQYWPHGDGFLPCYQCGTDTRYESRGRPCCGDCIA